MNDLFRLSPFLFHTAYIAHRVAFCLTRLFFTLVENSYTLIVSIHYSPSFPICFVSYLCAKNMFALNETNVYRVCCTPVDMRQGILRLCQFVRGNDFNPSDGCVYVFIIALATASSCSIGNVVALLCITSRWRRAV